MASHSAPRSSSLTGRRRTRQGTPAGRGTEAGSLAARMAALASRSGSPDDLTRAFLHEASSALSGKAWLMIKDSGGNPSWFPPGQMEPFPARLAARPDSLAGLAMAMGREALIADAGEGRDFPERRFLKRSEASQWAFLPVTSLGATMGCLLARGPRGGPMPAAGLSELRAVLPLMALCLRVGLMHEELDARVMERTQEIALLYEVSRAMGFIQRPEDLPPLLAQSLRRSLHLDLLCVTLPWAERGQAWVVPSGQAGIGAVRSLCRKSLAECRRASGRPPGKVAITLLGRASGAAAALHSADLKSFAHAPLSARGEMFGMLTVASRERGQFGEESSRLLLTCAAQAALCLDRLQAAREAETGRLKSMLDSMADGVLLVDRSLRVLMANPAARAHLATLTGAPLGERLTRIGDVALRSLMARLGSGDDWPQCFDVSTATRDRLFTVTCSPVQSRAGAPDRLVLVSADVTESRAMQMQAVQSERLSAMGVMISGVAHELNNPLATVMGHAQLLQTRELPGDASRKLDLINQEAGRCRRIVETLLAFCRPKEPERRALAVNGLAESVAELLGYQLRGGDIRLELDLDPDDPCVIGDEILLQQVVWNIAYNAFQALQQRGEGGGIRIASRRAGDRVEVEITDDGPGITAEHLPRLFDPFFTTKEVGKGTGLGLSLAFRTVHDHGGALTARSRQGEGATFLISLPAGPAAMGRRAAQGPPAAPARGIPGPLTAGGQGGRRILVVDDEQALAEVMAEALASYGHEVETRFDGRSAREAMIAGSYDAIITDLKMPGLNGRELYRQVVAARPEMARRIIFSTGDTASPETQAFLEKVGNPVLNKPFNLVEMVRLVDSILSER